MKTATIITALVITATLSGCASVRTTYAPDGRKAYALNCSGTGRGWDKCFSKAGDLCGGAGYDVLNSSGEGVAGASRYGAYATTERSMVIACRG